MLEITIMMCNFEVKIRRSTDIFPLSLIECFLKAVMIYVAASLDVSKTCIERKSQLILNIKRPFQLLYMFCSPISVFHQTTVSLNRPIQSIYTHLLIICEMTKGKLVCIIWENEIYVN